MPGRSSGGSEAVGSCGPPVIFLKVILIAYVAIGCVYWLWMAVGAVRVARGVPLLSQQDPPEPPQWPRLSIIVPACNEADTLEPAMATLLEQDYPGLEIILIDDRSTDGTGEVVDRIASADARIRAVHIAELPDGWLGKVHALARGVELARGDWLLFTDADVHLAPGMLRRVIAYAEDKKLDHLPVAPDLWSCGLLLDAAVSNFVRSGTVGARCWAVPDPKSGAYVGVGAFNLVRRSALARTPGLEWLRLEVADDVGIGLMMKRSGARCGVLNGTGHVGLHWYRSLGEMVRGAEKGFASVAACSMTRLLVFCTLVSGLELAPVVAVLPWGVPGLLPAGLLMTGLWLTSVVVIHRWANRPILPGLLMPLVVPLATAMFLWIGWLGVVRGGVLWRGTLYPSKILREGKRVWIG